MNRRNLIKSIFASGIALPLFGATKSFEPTMNKAITPNALQLKFGALDLYIFSDGGNTVKDPFPLIAPKQTEAEFNKARKETFLDQQPIAFSLNILLIKKGNQYILFDIGNGLGKNENVGRLLEQMQASTIEAHMITDIVITHAHGDHINGIVLPDGNFAFKNAKYYMGKKEFDFWMKSDNSTTKKY
jgi:Metal-dependent hydrolases of the beta-lactamase superfamily III